MAHFSYRITIATQMGIKHTGSWNWTGKHVTRERHTHAERERERERERARDKLTAFLFLKTSPAPNTRTTSCLGKTPPSSATYMCECEDRYFLLP